MPAGERVRSFTIVTTVPNELCAELHSRMPLILKPRCRHYGSVKRRPACRSQGAARALTVGRNDLLAGERARRHVKNNDPSLIEPVTPS